MWARNPIPRRRIGNGVMTAFPNYCNDTLSCRKAPVFESEAEAKAEAAVAQDDPLQSRSGADDGDGDGDGGICRCSEGGETGLGDLEIVDRVMVPASLPAGEYVVGFRWDCEESNQIWASCADVAVVG